MLPAFVTRMRHLRQRLVWQLSRASKAFLVNGKRDYKIKSFTHLLAHTRRLAPLAPPGPEDPNHRLPNTLHVSALPEMTRVVPVNTSTAGELRRCAGRCCQAICGGQSAV